jgi:Ig-like domain from next to BRCA1 gene
MLPKTRYAFFALLSSLTLMLSACGSSASNDSIIATSVAMTVQAQNTQEAAFTPTNLPATDVPPLLFSPTPGITHVPPTAPPASSSDIKPCYSADFVSDVTIPDGTIVSPGQTFWKTWRVTNSGSCAWDSSYKFVFMDGDIMGGGYVYSFPGAAAPGQTVDIPIQLYAPQAAGTYTGTWAIEAPDKTIFGVGQYSQPLSVKVVVVTGTPANNRTASPYGVADVTYNDVIRVCKKANTLWTYSANISSNGPVTVIFTWEQSDGHNFPNNKITFTDATTVTRSNDWQQGIASSTNPRWVRLVVTSPTYQEFPKLAIPPLCGY